MVLFTTLPAKDKCCVFDRKSKPIFHKFLLLGFRISSNGRKISKDLWLRDWEIWNPAESLLYYVKCYVGDISYTIWFHVWLLLISVINEWLKTRLIWYFLLISMSTVESSLTWGPRCHQCEEEDDPSQCLTMSFTKSHIGIISSEGQEIKREKNKKRILGVSRGGLKTSIAPKDIYRANALRG